MSVEIPHFKLPFAFVRSSSGAIAADVAEQESIEEIGSCAEAIIRTVQGERTTLPDFGRPQLEFNTDAEFARTAIAAALLEWEPRVESLIDADWDDNDEQVQVVRALIAPADSQEGEIT